jgi:hypothetical protein
LPTNAPPVKIQLSDPNFLASGSFTFNLAGAANLAVEVQATDDFVGWTTVTNLVPATSPQIVNVPSNAGKPHRFFRVQVK